VGIVVALCFLCGDCCSSLFANIDAPHDSPADAKKNNLVVENYVASKIVAHSDDQIKLELWQCMYFTLA
jgi:hypothetical protein